MIPIVKRAAPEILDRRGDAARRRLCDAHDAAPKDYRNGRRTFNFEESVYKAPAVRSALNAAQYDKCAFCESHYSHTGYGDVEHFRPKAGFRQTAGDSLKRPGYYWLAYAWENLFHSCQICNQRFKGNLFPLRNNRRRARSQVDSLQDEKPLLIDPGALDPTQFIGFRDEIPFAIGGCREGHETIQALGLDRSSLNENRRRRLEDLKNLVVLCHLLQAKVEAGESKWAERLASCQVQLRASLEPSGEYSAMARCYLESHGAV